MGTMSAIPSQFCAKGHKLVMGKNRKRCPICQSRYMKEWRDRKSQVRNAPEGAERREV